MVASLVVTGTLVYFQSRAIARTGSVAVRGDRAHYAADIAGNLAVMAGIAAGAFMGLTWADAVAGLLVAGWLGWGALEVARAAGDQLMDRELPEADRVRIAELARADGAIRNVHGLRTRASGALIHIQFHADMDANLSLRDAHGIVVAAENRIRAAFPGADIIIHPDPEGATDPHGHDFFADDPHAAERTP
jgi:cation diffusion facilitator family transporter